MVSINEDAIQYAANNGMITFLKDMNFIREDSPRRHRYRNLARAIADLFTTQDLLIASLSKRKRKKLGL